LSMGRPKRDVDTEFLELEKVKIPQPQRIAVSRHGMVSTAQYLASRAGARTLEQGGNAVDAAAAAAFALGVVEPQASGLGGQTMMLVYLKEEDRLLALDGSSRAPNRAVRENFTTRPSRLHGYTATTVPSTPAVLDYALLRFGTLPLPLVLEPAIRLAVDGYPVTSLQRKLQRRELKNLARGNAGNIFLREGDKAYLTGHVFKQPVLAQTLQHLAEKGIGDFYTGEIAHTIHQDMQRNGGLIQEDDLAQVPHPIEREPVSGRLGRMTVYTMPPPGAGRTLIEMINIIKKFPSEKQLVEFLETKPQGGMHWSLPSMPTPMPRGLKSFTNINALYPNLKTDSSDLKKLLKNEI